MEQNLALIVKNQVAEHLQGLTLAEAREFTVTDLESKKEAALRRDLASDAQKRISAFLDPHIKNAHKAWKDLTSTKATALEQPKAIEAQYKQNIMTYDTEIMRQRREAEAKEREALRKQEEEHRLKEAETLEQEGREEEAQAVLEQPIIIPSVKPQEDPEEKVQSYRDHWTAEVYDLKKVLGGLCDGTIPLAGIVGIEPIKGKDGFYESSFFDAQARTQKMLLNYPGVRVDNNKIPVSR